MRTTWRDTGLPAQIDPRRAAPSRLLRPGLERMLGGPRRTVSGACSSSAPAAESISRSLVAAPNSASGCCAGEFQIAPAARDAHATGSGMREATVAWLARGALEGSPKLLPEAVDRPPF